MFNPAQFLPTAVDDPLINVQVKVLWEVSLADHVLRCTQQQAVC